MFFYWSFLPRNWTFSQIILVLLTNVPLRMSFPSSSMNASRCWYLLAGCCMPSSGFTWYCGSDATPEEAEISFFQAQCWKMWHNFYRIKQLKVKEIPQPLVTQLFIQKKIFFNSTCRLLLNHQRHGLSLCSFLGGQRRHRQFQFIDRSLHVRVIHVSNKKKF